jgi:hypothetical protein
MSRDILDIRIALEDQAAVARGIESAVAGLDCGGGLAQTGVAMLLIQHANAFDGLVTALCEIAAAKIGRPSTKLEARDSIAMRTRSTRISNLRLRPRSRGAFSLVRPAWASTWRRKSFRELVTASEANRRAPNGEGGVKEAE